MMNVEEEQGGDHLFTIFTDRANLGPDRCKKYKKGKKGKKGKKEKKERVSKMLCDIRMHDDRRRRRTCLDVFLAPSASILHMPSSLQTSECFPMDDDWIARIAHPNQPTHITLLARI